MSRPSTSSAGYGRTPGAGSVTMPVKYSGTISTRPPTLMTIAVRMPSRPTFFSIFSWFMGSLPLRVRARRSAVRRLQHRLLGGRRVRGRDRLPDVVGHQEHAGEHQRAAGEPHGVERIGDLQ